MLILSSDSNCLPWRCSITNANKQLSHGVRSREQNVPTPPSPNNAPDFAHHNVDEALHCPGAKWHHAQAVLVVYGEWLASSYPARECSNIDQLLFYQLAWDDLAQVHFGWRTLCACLAEQPHYAVQCSFLVTLGQSIQNSVVAAEGQMNMNKECIAFTCPMLQMQMAIRKPMTFWSLLSTLCKNFSISPSCWWGYSNHLERFGLLWQLLCMKYCTYLQGEISLFHVVFIRRWCWGSSMKDITCLFLAILNSNHPSTNSFIWSSVCPWTFLRRCVIL